jgi:hypothetical protein
MRFQPLFCAVLAALPLFPARPAQAGVANPDISALGQVLGGYTDDVASADAEEPALRLGEAEFVFDAYLNPFLKGWFTLSGGEDGVGLEEAYASVVKGLPWGLALKAGKYRLGFGKLNPSHPHAYPFIESPRSLQSLLFGEEGFNETGAQISALLPTPGDWASTLSADVIEGKAFHPGQDGTRLGWLGRWANDFLLGEQGALQTGISGATGIDSLGRGSRAFLAGADVKAKFYLGGASQLTLQAEGVLRHSHLADTAAGTFAAEDRSGFYGFCDYRWHTQWNGGFLYEQWQREGAADATDRAFRAFAGYAVLEESTLLRLAYERFLPDGGDPVNTVSLQLLFSMGPHKAHQF